MFVRNINLMSASELIRYLSERVAYRSYLQTVSDKVTVDLDSEIAEIGNTLEIMAKGAQIIDKLESLFKNNSDYNKGVQDCINIIKQ